MKKHIYVVYDKLAKLAGPVFEARNDKVAMRMFKQLKKEQSYINDADYGVFRICQFDDESMEVEAENQLVEDYIVTEEIDAEEQINLF